MLVYKVAWQKENMLNIMLVVVRNKIVDGGERMMKKETWKEEKGRLWCHFRLQDYKYTVIL